jgi:hypothetical protein
MTCDPVNNKFLSFISYYKTRGLELLKEVLFKEYFDLTLSFFDYLTNFVAIIIIIIILYFSKIHRT